MMCQLEHVNISVVDLDRAVAFLQIAFPEFRIRGDGQGEFADGTSAWLHLGRDELYVSLNTSSLLTAAREKPAEQYETGINHVGFVVVDVEALLRSYEAAGFMCELKHELPARKRLYVADADGIIWEFVEYLSDDFAVRNDYSI